MASSTLVLPTPFSPTKQLILSSKSNDCEARFLKLMMDNFFKSIKRLSAVKTKPNYRNFYKEQAFKIQLKKLFLRLQFFKRNGNIQEKRW